MRRRRALIWIALLLSGVAVVGYQHYKTVTGYHFFDLAANVFPFDQKNGSDADIPSGIRSLDGTRVAFDGYVVPLGIDSSKITRFAVTPSLDRHHLPRVEQFVFVEVPATDGLDWGQDRVRVFGTLKVRVTKEQGEVTSIFTATADAVRPYDASAPPVRAAPLAASDATVCGLAVWGLASSLVGLKARLRARRRVRSAFCRRCGYDLRASPDRCPECGLPNGKESLPFNPRG